ncbi:MAG: MerR family transcriptional regulator [Clostridia bacterium]|nr:MerR family transcriptional regulator [Clostridia bacterium]
MTEETLRYYDTIGLLKPCHIDPDTGYRFYDISQSTKLDLIQYMKSLGIQLNEIKKLLDNGDFDFVQGLLEKQTAIIESEIQRLLKQKGAVDCVIESYEKLKTYPPTGVPLLEYIQKRYIFVLDVKEELYEEDDGEGYELGLRKLRAKMQQINLPYLYFCNAGVIVREDTFKMGKLKSSEVYAFVDSVNSGCEGVSTVAASTYLSIYCDDFHQELEYSQRLLDEIHQKGYRITGDYIYEEIAGVPIIKGNHRDMHYRLQVPICFS